ncbi:MAG: ribosomal protein S18-alanine N-acetyltransferase [Desulfopila sp.]
MCVDRDGVVLGPLALGDVEEIAAIEQSAFSPWSAEQIAAEFWLSGSVALVAREPAGRLCGWCCARYCGDEAELLKIAVSPQWRRRGYAKLLLDTLCGRQLARLAVATVYLEVRSRNVAALALYRGYGFQRVATRTGYYLNPTDDALVLRYNLGMTTTSTVRREDETAQRSGFGRQTCPGQG